MTDAIRIRDAVSTDLPQVLAINETVVPAVNSLDAERMQWFFETAPWFRVAEADDAVCGMLIGFFDGCDYQSENYRWFSEHFAHFAYVDRVAVRPSARRQGLATRLYHDFIDGMPAGVPVLTCEVNVEPPNPDSLRFHERLGFETVGRQRTEQDRKEVALLALELT
jgi:hypothetical protein